LILFPTVNHVTTFFVGATFTVALLALILPVTSKFRFSSDDGQTIKLVSDVCPMENISALPSPRDENFVGRKGDMVNITKLFKFTGDPRIVVLLGMPGVGKSTTAIQLAYQERKKGTVVMYVNLNGMGSVNDIKRKIVEKAFGEVPPAEALDGKFELWASGCSKPLLLIFDNFDQLLHYPTYLNFSDFFETGDSDDEPYLKRTTVLITSREEITRFQHLDVQMYPLAQLNVVNSIDLLANCLKFVTSREQLRPAAELIGGVPLALRIAADLMNLMKKKSIKNAVSELNAADLEKDIIENVTSKLKESLTKHLWVNNSDGSRDLPKRLSISTSIRVSYNYLSDKDKVCGQYLSSFPASFTLDAAVVIVGSLSNQSELSIKECLDTLQHLSLLQQSSDGEKMYDFHKLLKDFFNSELNSSEEELGFERLFCDFYAKRLQHFGELYLTDSVGSLTNISNDRHNLLYMLHLLERHIERNGNSTVLNTSVDAVTGTMSLKDGSILAHLFSSHEIHQSLTKVVEYVDKHYEKAFDHEGSMSPQEFTRYGTVVYFWAIRYSFARGKLPEEGALSVRSLEKKVRSYLSSITASDCSFPTVVIPCIRLLEITCYDKHNHTALELCSQGNETLALLTDKLEQHDHTQCHETISSYTELGLAHYTLRNIENATSFLEKIVRDPHLYSPEGSHVLVTLCSAYGYSERDDECDKLCESIIQDKTLDNVRVSGRNFRLFGLIFMYYWKHDMIDKTEKARNITEKLVHYFSNRFIPRGRGFRLDLRCLLTTIATYYHNIHNYSAAIEIYQLAIKTSFSAESVYHRGKPLVATTNDMLSAFCQFRMGMSKIADRHFLDGLYDINDAVTRTLTIARNETLHEYLINTTHPEDAEIVTMGSRHLASIVCEDQLNFHPQCLWEVLQGTLLHEWSNTQYMYYHICGYDDPYGASFDPWRLTLLSYNSLFWPGRLPV